LSGSEDKERIISSLRSQIASLTNEMSSLKVKSQVSVNVQGNTQEYEIKIRTLNSKIQELESQIRTQKVDYEGQLRTKNTTIRELEEQISSFRTSTSVLIPGSFSNLKPEDSRVTGTPYGTSSSSNIDRMSSSMTSSSSSLSGPGLSSSQYASNTQSGVRYSGSNSGYQSAQYGTSGTIAYGASSSTDLNITPVTSTYGAGNLSSYGSGSLGVSGGISGGITGGVSGGVSYGSSGVSSSISGQSGSGLVTGQTTTTYGNTSGSGYQSSTGGNNASGYQSYFSKYAKGGN
jgi:hypothetical protein